MGLFSVISAVVSPAQGEPTTTFERVVLHGVLKAREVWTPRADDPIESDMMRRFHGLAARAGAEPTPKVLIYEGRKPNAASLLNGTIVIDRKFLEEMKPDQVDAVLSHELTHHVRRSTVFPIGAAVFLGVAAVARYAVKGVTRPFTQPALERSMLLKAGNFVAEWAVGAVIALKTVPYILAPYWRSEEYKADQGGADLTSAKSMADSLETLKAMSARPLPPEPVSFIRREAEALAHTLVPKSVDDWLKRKRADHPPLEERIRRLRQHQEEAAAPPIGMTR